MKPKSPHEHNLENMPVGMLIGYAARIHIERIRGSLESFGIQKTFGPILKALSENEGLTQGELAGYMNVTAPSMSVNLQKMEAAGLLTRMAGNKDMRQNRLFLSENGRETADKAEKEIAQVEARLVEALTDREYSELRRMLIKLIQSQTE